MRLLHWLLLACAASLVAIGPAMALQELAKAEDDRARLHLTGELPPPETGFRGVWRAPLLVLLVAVGVLGSLLWLRVALQPEVRAVSGRLLGLLFAGMGVLDVAFYVDVTWFVGASYGMRAATIVWAYPVAGVLVGGSVHRLFEIESYFGRERKASP